MEKEKKEISRKALIGIIVALIIIIIIAFGVIIFFVGRNTAQTENTLKSNVNNNEIDDTNSVKTSKRTLEPTEENIREQIAFFNENEDLGLEPTQEQINEIIEYAKDLEEYNDDILMEFILQKGWTVRGTQMIDYDNLTMPNLVGMNYGDIREYLDNNNLYFIANINYKYENGIKDNDLLPTTVLSTIPEAGTKLDSYTDTSITVLTDYVYGVKTIELEEFYEDFELQNFGKTMKIQFGTNEQGIIEGIIGQDFKTETRSGNKKIFMRNKLSWDTVKTKKCAYFLKEDMTSAKDHPGNGLRWDYVKGKIWIDNQLFKELTFSYSSGAVTIATWK